MTTAVTFDALRRYAVARTLFIPTTLGRAIAKLGFVQADPIRAPARAQDLTLRHRVRNYCAGDLERHYPRLPIEEDFFVNYGFLPRTHQALMHPRVARTKWNPTTKKRAQDVLAFVRERGEVNPREVDERFAHGNAINNWGGSSKVTKELLDAMHYRGMLRVLRRDQGIRIYAIPIAVHGDVPADAAQRRAQLDALIDLIVRKYAPLPARSLGALTRRLRYGAPQAADQIESALDHARVRLPHERIEGVDWYWAEGERPASARYAPAERVHLLAPFDPIVWDRHRFELFWGWAYRFEAYLPAPKRKLGYYALPLLWRDAVIGWGNLAVKDGTVAADFGYVTSMPKGRGFKRELEEELERLRVFLRL